MVGNGSLHSRLRLLGVLGDKHVPAVYLRGSADQRLALLQGLMDSDGYADPRRRDVEFCNTNKNLVDAVVELARSLGQKPVAKESRALLYGRDCGPKWRVSWRPTVPVFRLSRKRVHEASPRTQEFRHQHRMIVRAERIDPVAMRCLTVDSPHHMYLAGEGMIPTHNTRTGSGTLADWILSDPVPGEWGICAPTYRDAWTVCVAGEAGILQALGTSEAEVKNHTSAVVEYAHRSYGEIGLYNGHIIRVDSADDGALRVQGHNLRGLWADELGLWQRWQVAWEESIAFAVRHGKARIVATTTPKISRPAAKLIRKLIRDEASDTVVTRLRTVDNIANLAPAFVQAVVARASGTRLERQELEGELLDDVENSLWTRDLLESIQADGIPGALEGMPSLSDVFVGVDPSDGTEEGDEQAYTVSGIAGDLHLYVAESWGGRLGPVPFLKRAVLAAQRWNGTLVLEKNHGGAYLTATLVQVMKDLGVTVPYRVVHASQAKRTRAEPVAALYERGVVRHVNGPHVDLEDQMVTFVGGPGERSPDRLDSLVWSITPHLNRDFDFSGRPRPPGVRKYAAAADLESAGRDPRARRMTPHMREQAERREDSWSLDSFAPQDDRPRRPNVRAWR
jgi:phage terminase large subunit-like protein